jgi:hypothetical protein
MELNGKINLLDETVSIERGAIRTNAIMALSILFISLTGAALLYILAKDILDATPKLVTSICTALTSFLSGIPASSIPNKRVKIATLNYLKKEYANMQNNPTCADPQLITELEKRFWTFFDKNL